MRNSLFFFLPNNSTNTHKIDERFTFQKILNLYACPCHTPTTNTHRIIHFCMPAHKRISYIREAYNKEVEAAAQRTETLYDRIVLIRHNSSLYEDIESSYLNDRIASIRQSASLNQNNVTAPFSERIESTRKAFNHATKLFNIAKKDNREVGMAGPTHSSPSEVTSGQKQKLPSSGPSESRSRTGEEAPQEGSVQRLDSQEAPAEREPSPSPSPSPAPAPAPKPVRSRLKIEKQVELIEVCTRWIRLYVHDKNGGKTFWDKVHEVLENAGTKYSADSCKNFVTSMVHNYEQRAPIVEELEGPLRAWKLAVEGRKREEKQLKIDQEKAKKEKAQKKKADKEKGEKGRAEKKAEKDKADKEKADQEKADKETTAKRSGSKKPAASTKRPTEAPRTTVADSQEDMEANSTVDTSIPSIESDHVGRRPKRRLADITAGGESPPKRPRTRSCTAQNVGRRPMGQTRATSLQPGQTQRRPSVPPSQVANPAAKPAAKTTAKVPPPSKPGEKRKGPPPELSTRPAKKVKTTHDVLEEIANGLDSRLTSLETNIDGKFGVVKKELEVLKAEIANLSNWHVQLNDAINHEQGIAIKEGSKAEARDTSEAVVNTTAEVDEVEQSSGNEDERKSTDEDDESKSMDEDAEPTTRAGKLETIPEITEITDISTSEKSEQQAPEDGCCSTKDTTAAESSGDDPASSSSDEDEEVPAPLISKPPGWHA